MNMVYIWLIVAFLAVVAEAVTVQMVAIWFAPAALVAHARRDLRRTACFADRAICTCFRTLRSVLVQKAAQEHCRRIAGKTNLDALIGASAKVETEIPQDGRRQSHGQGNQLAGGLSRRCAKDAHVRVLSIDGVTLNCERIPIPAEQMK